MLGLPVVGVVLLVLSFAARRGTPAAATVDTKDDARVR